jgi:hypothetical protein
VLLLLKLNVLPVVEGLVVFPNEKEGFEVLVFPIIIK